jgi:ASC-1-like (ASCH) protein
MASTIHNITIDDIYFGFICNETKPYEMRLNDEKRKDIKVGDFFKFTSKSGKIIIVNIIDRIEFKNFSEAIDSIGYKNLMPQMENADDTKEAYLNFDGYKQKEKEFGVVVFKLCLLKE